MRPIFCGNFEFDARQSELERLFRRYGKVDRVDMKSGFAFVYMEDERDAEDAIRGLDRIEFGRKGRRLRVEWTKQERSVRKPVSSRRSSSLKPSKTLFVINFDPYHTRTRDLERHFDPYGKILNIRIRKNFAFIQFETQEDASKALDATNMSKLMDRVISVEFAIKDDDDRRNGHGPDRSRDRSPQRSIDKGRSPSPYRRERASPDYGRGRGRGRSPSPYQRERASPDYGRGPSPSLNRRERNPDYGRGPSPSPNRRERNYNSGRGLSPSPKRRERNSESSRGASPNPRRGRPSPDHDLVPSARERLSPDDYRHGPSSSPSPRRERVSPDDYDRGASPNSKPEELRDSPGYGGAESPIPDQDRSPSPPLARVKSPSPSPSRSPSRSRSRS